MIRAIIRGGQIHPTEPLPHKWSEGHEVVVEDAGDTTASDLEEWYRELQNLGPALSEPGEWEEFQAILAEAMKWPRPRFDARWGCRQDSRRARTLHERDHPHVRPSTRRWPWFMEHHGMVKEPYFRALARAMDEALKDGLEAP